MPVYTSIEASILSMSGSGSSIARLPRALLGAAAPAIGAVLHWLGADPMPFAGCRCVFPTLRPGSVERARAVYGGLESPALGWLADLEAGGLDLYRVFARRQFRLRLSQGLDSDLRSLAHRVLDFCRHGRFLLTGASDEFASLFFDQLGRDVRRLTRSRVRTPDEAVQQSAPVLAAALCFGGPDRLASEAAARLAVAAEAVILPDGGHVSRSPGLLLATLELLCPLRQLMTDMRIAVPQGLTSAVERALPMLRMLSHGDGGLSLLQNIAGPEVQVARALQAENHAGLRLPHLAKFSGFARLNLGHALVLIDAGSHGLCDSALAFEFSDGPNRIAGSCGFPMHASRAWMEAAASPPAHSTLDIRGAPRANFERLLRRMGTTPTRSEVISSPQGMLFKGRSSRSEASLGLRHCRELFLSADGSDFRGEDRFERVQLMESDWPERPFALRFHLHPTVTPALDFARGTVEIGLPSGARWQFTARGGSLSLEDSIFLATGGVAQDCQQIVIRGQLGRPVIVHWAFRRLPEA